jgi:hypothetical protein
VPIASETKTLDLLRVSALERMPSAARKERQKPSKIE